MYRNKKCPYCGASVYWSKVGSEVGSKRVLFSLLNGPHICGSTATSEPGYDCEQCGGFGVINLKDGAAPCLKCIYEVS